MTIEELSRLSRAHDPSVVLVGSRILRRVIKSHRKIASLGLQVPHAHSYVVPRAALLPVVDDDDLGAPVASLPEVVLLLARPHAREVEVLTEEEALVWLWRRVFHARIHIALEEKLAALGIAERIDRIGQTEFDEVRGVLRQEALLLPPSDDRAVWVEFAALYLELRHFEPARVARFFPSLGDPAAIDALLGADLDAASLLLSCRPRGAPDLSSAEPEEKPEPLLPTNESFGELRTKARVAGERGNAVRAAVLWSRAARCDVEGSEEARREALASLSTLATRLRASLGGHGPDEGSWHEALLPLLARGDVGRFNLEARLLYDLQKACNDAERELFKVEFWGWLRSFGRRPLKRAVPAERLARATKHLRVALKRAARVLLLPAAHERLLHVLGEAVHAADANLRTFIGPIIEATLEAQPGLVPRSAAERIAQRKIVAELCDRISTRGFIHIGDLRDAISRNELKLPNLGNPLKLLMGDELLRADSRLADDLCGVYRRGEIYMRFLQRVSSLGFGTIAGRLLTRFAILPFGAAFVVLEGLQHILRPIVRAAGYRLHMLSLPSFIATGVFLLGLFYVPPFRRGLLMVLKGLWRALRFVLYDGWKMLWALPAMRRVLDSSAYRYVKRLLLEPAVIGLVPYGIVRLCGGDHESAVLAGGIAFSFVLFLLNTSQGVALGEVTTDAMARAWQELRYHILPGVVQIILEAFRSLMERIERGLYAVDEWLRFRGGESPLTFALKASLGLVWGVVTYLFRIYVNILVEPQVNPIKHFPVVTVSHKIILPFTLPITRVLSVPLVPIFGHAIGTGIAAATTVLLPGAFGFLVWELKENWRLYGANRAKVLKPAVVGHHSETTLRLMKPGFHSGTLPKLYAKLRRAERKARPELIPKLKTQLHEVDHAVRTFIERDLCATLAQTRAFAEAPLEVAGVELGSNRIRVALACPALGERALLFAFEEQSGWLVAGITRRGWLRRASLAQRNVFALALCGLYARAGVDIVRTQLQSIFGIRSYDVASEGVVVWPGPGYETKVVYPLDGKETSVPKSDRPHAMPPLPLRALLFSKTPVEWSLWVSALESARAGGPVPAQLLEGVVLLPPVEPPADTSVTAHELRAAAQPSQLA